MIRFRPSVVAVLAPFVLALSDPAPAAEADHRHHVAIVGGFASKSSKSANFLGFEYEYRLNDNWGIGGEGKLDSAQNLLLLRGGISYEFHLNSLAISPLLAVDWIENNSNVGYLGVGFGYRF